MPAAEEVLSPPTLGRPMEPAHQTVAVIRGNIQNEAIIPAFYIAPRVDALRFSSNDIPVAGIFVSVGTHVAAGDIIAALNLPEIQAQYDDLNRRRAALQFEISLVNERRNLAANLGNAQAQYQTNLNNLNAELELTNRLLAQVALLNEERYLRAGIDGTIVHAHHFVEGMVSNTRNTIAQIAETAFPYFVVWDDLADSLNHGDVIDMHMMANVFPMAVINPEDFGLSTTNANGDHPAAYLAFAGVNIPTDINSQTRANINIFIEEISNVLFIPDHTLHRYDDRAFVYVLQDGVRVVRDVVIGFEGGGLVEILSGLEEGELVIQ